MQYAISDDLDRLKNEIAAWERSDAEKGQIYTRPEVVELMIYASGLADGDSLEKARILEPSCGEGEFIVAIVRKLLGLPKAMRTAESLKNRLLAVDLVEKSVEIAKRKVSEQLLEAGYSLAEVKEVIESWFLVGDFLLEDIQPGFTHIIGNPPYVRVENIPKTLLKEYRRRFATMTDRADLYIPFYEKSLSLLADNGRLSFICTDRWTKNTYGRSMRRLVSEKYGLELFIDLYGVEAFGSSVMTYPAITQLVNARCDTTLIQHGTKFDENEGRSIYDAIQGSKTLIQQRKGVVDGDKPWLFGCTDQLSLIRSLESAYPTLEDAGCKVYIGAATGSNRVYVVEEEFAANQIEESRVVPVITAAELKSGSAQWKRKYLINTYDENGVIHLDDYPLLARYLNSHKTDLIKRHVAKKDSNRWFKTIDRVYRERAFTEKLLIPDISANPIVVFDPGHYHPNNSIYYITSAKWNLHALRAILLSNLTKVFLTIYSTKVANGFFRFQAQHLRRLRVPEWNTLDPKLKELMIAAGKSGDVEACNEVTCRMYGFSEDEKNILGV